MRIYLIRHPRPRDAIGLCYGRRDIAVDGGALGDAAAAVRERISERVLRGAPIFSSPSTRCVMLARELAAPREPTTSDELMEMSFGSWEGQRWDALPREQLDAWAADVWSFRPGGAESAEMVARRWRRWSADVRQSAVQDGAAVAVTHAGIIRIALACAGVLDTQTFSQAPIAFGSVHRIDLGTARP